MLCFRVRRPPLPQELLISRPVCWQGIFHISNCHCCGTVCNMSVSNLADGQISRSPHPKALSPGFGMLPSDPCTEFYRGLPCPLPSSSCFGKFRASSPTDRCDEGVWGLGVLRQACRGEGPPHSQQVATCESLGLCPATRWLRVRHSTGCLNTIRSLHSAPEPHDTS